MAGALRRRCARPRAPGPWRRTSADRAATSRGRAHRDAAAPPRRARRVDPPSPRGSAGRPWRWHSPAGPCGWRRRTVTGLAGRHEAEPEEVVRAEREEVRQLADGREWLSAPDLDRHASVELAQVELH